MRIGIDARFFGPKQKGLGRYSQKLIEKLQEIDSIGDDEYYIFLRQQNFNDFEPKNKKFKKVLAEYAWYGWKEQLFFPLLIYKHNIDLMHFCHFNVPIFYRKKFLVTIHDLILFHFPTIKNTTLGHLKYFFKMLMYHWVIRSTVRRAEKIIAVSNYTKKDIEKEINVPKEKIVVIEEGFDFKQSFEKKDSQTTFKKYGIMKPYLLYIGNAYPHKNLEKLCEAFYEIEKQYPALKLVIVGGEDYFFNRLKRFIEKNKIEGIIFPGFVSDVELEVFYQEAELFVFPSLYEGFGLPPLEALSRDLAVVSSERTSMPEVLGEAVQYFDPESVESMTENIVFVLKSPERKKEIIEKGKERLKIFSWEKMAKEILDVYRKNLR